MIIDPSSAHVAVYVLSLQPPLPTLGSLVYYAATQPSLSLATRVVPLLFYPPVTCLICLIAFVRFSKWPEKWLQYGYAWWHVSLLVQMETEITQYKKARGIVWRPSYNYTEYKKSHGTVETFKYYLKANSSFSKERVLFEKMIDREKLIQVHQLMRMKKDRLQKKDNFASQGPLTRIADEQRSKSPRSLSRKLKR